MQKLLPETTWDDGNSNAEGNAFLKQPKIAKPVIKAMCAATMQTYHSSYGTDRFNIQLQHSSLDSGDGLHQREPA